MKLELCERIIGLTMGKGSGGSYFACKIHDSRPIDLNLELFHDPRAELNTFPAAIKCPPSDESSGLRVDLAATAQFIKKAKASDLQSQGLHDHLDPRG